MWQSIKRNFNRHPVIVILVLTSICMLIPLAGYLQTQNVWKALPPAPSRPVQLLGTAYFYDPKSKIIHREDDEKTYIAGHVYILAENEQVYTFNLNDQLWREGLASHISMKISCDTTGPFLDQKSGQCVQDMQYDKPLLPNHRFLLEQDGTVWHWRVSSDSTYRTTFFLLCLCICPIFGTLIVFLFMINRQQKVKIPDQA
jgi:hypothetical protein